MCHRTRIWTVVVLALGIGLILSCLFTSWLIRLLIGIVLVALSLLLSHQI